MDLRCVLWIDWVLLFDLTFLLILSFLSLTTCFRLLLSFFVGIWVRDRSGEGELRCDVWSVSQTV